jgi:hypothetical protein
MRKASRLKTKWPPWYATYLLIAFAIGGPAFIAYSNARIDDPAVQAVLVRFFLLPDVTVAPLAGFAILAAGELAGKVGRHAVPSRPPRPESELGSAAGSSRPRQGP